MFALKYSAARLLGAPVIAIGAMLAMSGFGAVNVPTSEDVAVYWGDFFNVDLFAVVLGWLGVSGGMFLILAGIAMVIRPTRVTADETGLHVVSPFSTGHYLWEDVSGFEKAGLTSLRILLTPAALKLLGNSDPHMPRPPWKIEAGLFERLRASKGGPSVIQIY